jgi:hypothetical protein
MKKWFLLSLILIFPLFALGQNGTNSVKHVDKMNLKGAVKSIKHTAYEPGSIETDSINLVKFDFFGMHNYIHKFDREGWLIEKVEFKLRERQLIPSGIWTYDYDEEHRLAKESYIFDAIDGSDTATFEYTYPFDSLTTVVEKRKGKFQRIYHYILENRTEEFITINTDSSYIGKSFFEMDDQSRVIRKEEYSNVSRLQNLTINFYQDEIIRTPSRVLKTHFKSGQVYLTENLLDDQGNITSQKNSSFYTGESKTTTYIHIYDTTGNWIEKREFIDNHPRKVFRREIEYYLY